MTLSGKVIHVLQAFKCDFCRAVCSSWQDFSWYCASRGTSGAAELLVISTYSPPKNRNPVHLCKIHRLKVEYHIPLLSFQTLPR